MTSTPTSKNERAVLRPRQALVTTRISVATFQRRAAEVVSVQVLELKIRTGRTVVNEDPFAQRREVRVVRARSGEGRTRGDSIESSGYRRTRKSLRLAT